jgi:hypothetical protein
MSRKPEKKRTSWTWWNGWAGAKYFASVEYCGRNKYQLTRRKMLWLNTGYTRPVVGDSHRWRHIDVQDGAAAIVTNRYTSAIKDASDSMTASFTRDTQREH